MGIVEAPALYMGVNITGRHGLTIMVARIITTRGLLFPLALPLSMRLPEVHGCTKRVIPRLIMERRTRYNGIGIVTLLVAQEGILRIALKHKVRLVVVKGGYCAEHLLYHFPAGLGRNAVYGSDYPPCL